MQQALKYAEMLDIPFAYSTNGLAFREHDMLTGVERELKMDDFPDPEELWKRYCEEKNYTVEEQTAIKTPYYFDTAKRRSPRYYQRVAVNRVVEAVARGARRALLVMATGTGKTYTAFQIIHRLRQAGLVKHALFIADRNILVDQTMMQDFKPFGNAMTKVTGRRFDPAYEVHLALYQQFIGSNGEKHYTSFQRDFFDLIVIDECHRGSVRDDSLWREILDYFNTAVHVGMTATPRDEEDGSNLDHFGNPTYTYPLKQGIADGFLAPYKVIHIGLDLDFYGWHPEQGEVDEKGQIIEDRLYTLADFNKHIEIRQRTQAVARRITQWLRENGPMSKTIIFCVNTDHALRLREALVELNKDEVAKDPRYIMRITGNDPEGCEQLDNFIDVYEPYPVVATTSQMLTTGVDCKMCRLIVLDAPINSKTVFKQIIGRGTRLLWNDEDGEHDKRFFTVMDFRNATRHFTDKDFDGDIEVIEEEPCKVCGEFPCVCDRMGGEDSEDEGDGIGEVDGIEGEGPVDGEDAIDGEDGEFPPDDEDFDGRENGDVNGDDFPDEDGEDSSIEMPPLENPDVAPFYVVEGNKVTPIIEVMEYYGANGELVKDNMLSVRDGIKREFGSLEKFRARWNDTFSKAEIYEELASHEIFIEELRKEIGEKASDYDDFDIICHIAFGQKPMTRAERVAHAKKSEVLLRYFDKAREVLDVLLDKYAETGETKDLGDFAIFSNASFCRFGSGQKIAGLFGGKDKLQEAMLELQRAIYFTDTQAA